MRRRHRHAGERSRYEAQRGGSACRETLVDLELDHIHGDVFDDAFAADRGAQTHIHGAQHHEPYGQGELGGLAESGRQSDAEHEHAHELLAVLGAMHEGDSCARDDLAPMKHLVRFGTLHIPTEPRDDFRRQPPHAEAEEGRKQDAVNDLHPFAPVNGIEAADCSDGRARQAGDKRMALRRRYAEEPRCGAPDDDGHHSRGQSRQGGLIVAAEIDHFENGVGDGAREHRDDEQS